MRIENARGYAFAALRAAHARQLKWAKYAAASRHGYYPSVYGYTEDGLALFDRMYATATHDLATTQDIINTIIREMARSVDATYLGHFKYLTRGRDTEYITTAHDVILDQPAEYVEGEEYDRFSTIGTLLPYTEVGYAAFEDADLMRMRLRLVASRLNAHDMAALTAYIDGASFEDAVSAGSTQSFIKRMRTACAGLEGSVVFG